MKTVVGLYDGLRNANQVVKDLTDTGIDPRYISIIAGDPEGRYSEQLMIADPYDEGDAAADGAVAGGVLGGLTGVLLGLGAFAIPGLGPIVGAGPLLAGLAGAGIGAASGGLLGALVEWGVSEEEAEFYLEGMRRGGVLVAVRASDDEVDRIVDIMDQPGLLDLQEQMDEWRAEGWQGYEAGVHDELAFDTQDQAFQRHYEENFADTQFPYTTYTPAYRFGYFLATHDQFMGRNWHEIENEARQMWEAEHDEPWEAYKGAVEYSWRRAHMKTI